jgi:hypothetical protein
LTALAISVSTLIPSATASARSPASMSGALLDAHNYLNKSMAEDPRAFKRIVASLGGPTPA